MVVLTNMQDANIGRARNKSQSNIGYNTSNKLDVKLIIFFLIFNNDIWINMYKLAKKAKSVWYK